MIPKPALTSKHTSNKNTRHNALYKKKTRLNIDRHITFVDRHMPYTKKNYNTKTKKKKKTNVNNVKNYI